MAAHASGRPASSSRLRESPPRLTGRGWALLGLSCLLAGLGIHRHEPSCVQVGLMGLCLVATAWPLAVLNVRGIRCEREVPAEAFAGGMILATLRLRNTRRHFGARHLDWTDEVLGPFGKGLACQHLRPGEAAGQTLECRFRERGLDPRFRWHVSSSHPGGLWNVGVTGRERVSTRVYPGPILPANLDDPQAMAENPLECHWQPRPDWTGDYLGIRDFAPGDPLKSIHWRATARTQRLVVREFDRHLPGRFALFFHSYQPPGRQGSDDAFESALGMLAGLLIRCRDTGVPLELTADFNDWRTMTVDDTGSLTEPLTLLAGARRRASDSIAPLNERLRRQEAGCHAYVVSDTPVRHWEALIPPAACELTCLSVAELRRKSPPRTFTRTA